MLKENWKSPLQSFMNGSNNRAYFLKKRGVGIAVSIFRYVFLISFSYVLIYPLIFMISHSVQMRADYLDPTVQWVPKGFTFENFRVAYQVMDFTEGLLSTLGTQILSGLIEIVTCAIAAYGMARFDFKGKKLLNMLLILNILMPTTMIIIPSYVNFKSVDFFGILGALGNLFGTELRPNLLNTPFAFIVPSLFAVGLQAGLFIYIYIQFFKGFPRELEEAAWIDGAGPWNTFFRIVVPSSGVAVLTVAIFSVIWHWNEYYTPAMYLSEKFPLSVRIHEFFNMYAESPVRSDAVESINAGMAACVMFILPVLIMYLILQRRFIESIAKTGIVG